MGPSRSWCCGRAPNVSGPRSRTTFNTGAAMCAKWHFCSTALQRFGRVAPRPMMRSTAPGSHLPTWAIAPWRSCFFKADTSTARQWRSQRFRATDRSNTPYGRPGRSSMGRRQPTLCHAGGAARCFGTTGSHCACLKPLRPGWAACQRPKNYRASCCVSRSLTSSRRRSGLSSCSKLCLRLAGKASRSHQRLATQPQSSR